MAESLKNKTVKGVGRSAADAFWEQSVTFLVGIVFAHILSPSEYGQIEICLIFTSILSGVVDGVDSSFSNSEIKSNRYAINLNMLQVQDHTDIYNYLEIIGIKINYWCPIKN